MSDVVAHQPTLVLAKAHAKRPAGVAPVVLIGMVLAALAILRVSASLAAVVTPWELEWGEALVHDHAARIVGGEPLYRPTGQTFFSVATYTPLYYYIAAGLQSIFGLGFGPGRAFSLVAALITAGMIASIVQWRTRDWTAGGFAAALFLALGIPVFPPTSWAALYKEDMLGVALSFGVIMTLVSGTTRRHLILAGVLAALAFLTKQTMLIAGLAGFIWLLRQDRKDAAVFTGVASIVVAVVLVPLELITSSFVVNTMVANINPFRFQLFADLSLVLLRLQGGVILAGLLYLFLWSKGSADRGHDLIVYYWVASGLLILATLGKTGTNTNHWMPFATCSVVLVTIGIWQHLHGRASQPRKALYLTVLLLAANVLVVGRFTSAAVAFTLNTVSPDTRYLSQFNQVVDRVRHAPGEVLADPPDVIALAGRPILTEPWAMSLAYHEKIWPWDERPLVELICSGGVGLVVLGYTLEDGGPEYGVPRWPPPALQALRDSLVLDAELAGRFVYSYRRPPADGFCHQYNAVAGASLPQH